MFDLTSSTIQFQKDRRAKEDAIYNENKKYVDTLFWISIFEISVICLTGIYQFFSVKNFLVTKNYLWLIKMIWYLLISIVLFIEIDWLMKKEVDLLITCLL